MADQNQLTLDIEVVGDTANVRCHGALTLTSVSLLKDEVERLLPHTQTITIDFSDVAMIDSRGLGTLATLTLSARWAGHELRFANESPRVREACDVTRLP